jgi:hypothetical protein
VPTEPVVLAMDDRRDEVKRASEQEETTYLQSTMCTRPLSTARDCRSTPEMRYKALWIKLRRAVLVNCHHGRFTGRRSIMHVAERAPS